MTPDEKLAAAGLTDVEVIDHAEFDRLPVHKREVRTVFVRLPDPPPVVALRRILDYVALAEDESMRNVVTQHVRDIAEGALAEFDGTTT